MRWQSFSNACDATVVVAIVQTVHGLQYKRCAQTVVVVLKRGTPFRRKEKQKGRCGRGCGWCTLAHNMRYLDAQGWYGKEDQR